MLTTEPLDTTNIVDASADLSTPFDYLTNSDSDADNADLGSARRWAWYCCICTNTARIYGHINR
jgi:hypothetical protein